MVNEVEKIILDLLDENDNNLFGHIFNVNKEHKMQDQNNNVVDLSKVICATIYENEMVLYTSANVKYLVAFEGIEKFCI